MAWSRSTRVPASPDCPALARSFVSSALVALYRSPAAARSVIDDATVIVSELVTNAVQAASPAVEVVLQVEQHVLLVSVSDYTGGRPVLASQVAPQQLHGRGLAIVAALSRDWGVSPRTGPGPGKTVWARLDLASPPDGPS